MSRIRMLQRYWIMPLILLATFGTCLSQEKPEPSPAKTDKVDNSQVTSQDEGWVDVMLGIGSLITNPKNTNYEIKNNSILQARNLGSATPQFLTGLSFTLPFGQPKKWTKVKAKVTEYPWRAFVSVKFSPGSSEAVNGFVIGGSYRLGKLLDILAGFALSPINEVSPGFQRAAIQAVKDNSTLDAYKTFNINDLANNALNAFDGFPILKQTATGPQSVLYAGEALTTHYRGGFIIGIAFPLRLKALLSSGGAQTSPPQAPDKKPVPTPAENEKKK